MLSQLIIPHFFRFESHSKNGFPSDLAAVQPTERLPDLYVFQEKTEKWGHLLSTFLFVRTGIPIYHLLTTSSVNSKLPLLFRRRTACRSCACRGCACGSSITCCSGAAFSYKLYITVLCHKSVKVFLDGCFYIFVACRKQFFSHFINRCMRIIEFTISQLRNVLGKYICQGCLLRGNCRSVNDKVFKRIVVSDAVQVCDKVLSSIPPCGILKLKIIVTSQPEVGIQSVCTLIPSIRTSQLAVVSYQIIFAFNTVVQKPDGRRTWRLHFFQDRLCMLQRCWRRQQKTTFRHAPADILSSEY